MTPARFHRSTREAFADERFPAIEGPYRGDHLGPVVTLIVAVCAVLLCLGVVHVLATTFGA